MVSIGQLRDRLNEAGDLLAERIFHPGECAGASVERLAGLFAAKEATLKALNLPAGAWLEILIEHDSRGAPKVCFLEPKPWMKEITVSISHTGDYAIAVVAAILE
jgi:phosphopantetheine--protein transferase-like protein